MEDVACPLEGFLAVGGRAQVVRQLHALQVVWVDVLLVDCLIRYHRKGEWKGLEGSRAMFLKAWE